MRNRYSNTVSHSLCFKFPQKTILRIFTTLNPNSQLSILNYYAFVLTFKVSPLLTSYVSPYTFKFGTKPLDTRISTDDFPTFTVKTAFLYKIVNEYVFQLLGIYGSNEM